jgi:hypothetical protein
MRLTVVLKKSKTGRVYIPLAKDPPAARLRGTVNGATWRGNVEEIDGERGLVLGPAWRRGCGGVAAGDEVTVVLEAEGPQRGGLAPDVEAALGKNKKASAFWDELATFYKKAYLSYIDATKRNPERRPERIAEVVGLLAKGVKERG